MDSRPGPPRGSESVHERGLHLLLHGYTHALLELFLIDLNGAPEDPRDCKARRKVTWEPSYKLRGACCLSWASPCRKAGWARLWCLSATAARTGWRGSAVWLCECVRATHCLYPRRQCTLCHRPRAAGSDSAVSEARPGAPPLRPRRRPATWSRARRPSFWVRACVLQQRGVESKPILGALHRIKLRHSRWGY